MTYKKYYAFANNSPRKNTTRRKTNDAPTLREILEKMREKNKDE